MTTKPDEAAETQGPELLPCPWCGELPIVRSVLFRSKIRHEVECINLRCSRRPNISQGDATKKAVIALWNADLARTPPVPAAPVDVLAEYLKLRQAGKTCDRDYSLAKAIVDEYENGYLVSESVYEPLPEGFHKSLVAIVAQSVEIGRVAADLAAPTADATWERLRELLDRYAMPCLGDCEHSQCPLLRELWLMMEEERIKEALAG